MSRPEPPGWPAELADGPLVVRPLSVRDAAPWVRLRRTDHAWLAPWESTPPGRTVGEATYAAYLSYVVEQRRLAAAGASLPFALHWDGRLVGQVTVSGIVRGSMHGGSIGYWIGRAHAGRGIMPTALALVVDHCFTAVGLHRIESHVRPENGASMRVMAKLGFVEEGVRRGLLHVDGAFRDHVTWALLAEDVAPAGLLARWRGGRTAQ